MTRGEKKQVSQEVGQCQLWAWVGGKRPLWQALSLGAGPQWPGLSLCFPELLWINTEGSEGGRLPLSETGHGPEGG